MDKPIPVKAIFMANLQINRPTGLDKLAQLVLLFVRGQQQRSEQMNKQEWISGQMVKVGFLTLRVVRKTGFGWELESADGARVYEFTPYNGLARVQ